MIVSMTGFGDASVQRDGTHYSVEVRSLNNRFFKPVIKLPDLISGLEPEVEVMLRDRLGRGSITCIVKTRSDTAEAAYPLNMAALKSYVDQLRSLGYFKDGHTEIAPLLLLPGVCQEPTDDSAELDKHGPVVRELVSASIDKLIEMRKREGAALFEELNRHVTVIDTNLIEVEKRAPSVVAEYHKRLTARVNELIGKAQLKINESDLLKEIAVFAERSDIAEEIQRLRHHCKQFRESCKSAEHAGRKLDFISQEMLREANTIASKGNDAQIAGYVVEIKGAIDRLKEQVQNVE
ncbi:MAG TPA: YicC family protein [Tepidisphaeraceae bacterium]|nr:YicC family protein [Tepidisphaeraceae bacterium]